MAGSRITFPGPGCIVECMQGNKPVQHWVLETQGDSVRLLSAGRRESKLSVSRLLPWYGPVYNPDRSRQDMADMLEQHRLAREKLAAECDIMQVWELAQGEVDRASVSWLAELVWENPDEDRMAAVGHAALACKTHFKFNPPNFEIYDAAKVELRLTEQESVRQREEFAGIGGEFFRLLWGVHLGARGPVTNAEKMSLGLSSELAEQLAAMIRLRIADPETNSNAEAWKLLTKSLPDEPHLALHLAVAWGLAPEHHNFWLDRAGYDVTGDWAEPFVEELAALQKAVTDAAPNVPDAQGPFVSIDPPQTLDVDDAFSLTRGPDGSFALSLAFACPALFWPFGSGLDKAVLRRASSIYLPEGDQHMLPRETAALFSLLQGELRPTLLLDISLSPDGTVANLTPRTAWVRLAANLTVDACEALLGGDDAESGLAVSPEEAAAAAPHAAMLRDTFDLAVLLQQRRINAGAVITEKPDALIFLREEAGRTLVTLKNAPLCVAAHLLVGELMILANTVLAAWATREDAALLYRTQDVALPKEFAGVWTNPEDIARIVRHLPPAVVETSPRPHAGLGVSCYAPLTSPIRRYTDLVNEGQIVTRLLSGNARYSRRDLDATLPLLSSAMEQTGQIQRFRPRYWKLLFYKQAGDKAWHDAVVTEENDMFVFLSLPLGQITVRARRRMMGEKIYAGQRLKVRIGKVNPLLNEITVLEVMEN